MGGYPSALSNGKKTSESVSIGTGISVYLDNQSSTSSSNRPNSSTNNSRSQSDPNISRKGTYKATESNRRSLLLKTSDEELARNEDDDIKTDVFSSEPENRYAQFKVLQESLPKTNLSPKTPLIALDSSNSQTSYHKRTPMVQKEESYSPSGSSSRSRKIIIEERPFSPSNNPITISSPKNQAAIPDPQGLTIGVPLNHSTSVRIGKKKTQSSEIDAILNPNSEFQMKKIDPFAIPQHRNQRYDNKPSEKNAKDLKKKTTDPNTKMANDVDNFINLMLSKDAEEPEQNINDLREVSLPTNPAHLTPVTYHGGANRRRKSTTTEDVDDIEKQLEALKRSRSTFSTNKRKDVQPVNNPMIVVVGGDHTLTKDKSLYNVGGIISEKKKMESAKRKTRNRRKSFTMDLDNEDESVGDERDEFNFELETECATEYTESEFEN
ncbi:predicted protein [Naegleria gruberi]|uniref:Predicted protein n=1 Tax=Naegleria gruberi TaxID=5762 RepID=D2V0W8_NAEGR|nr:uncharacterized protein NAEGRDRAFT_62443 [Naegleria gruberi]EFC49587.1 predicted protein [Naegleria gruberi]|eukprot:XP_002682331.1 predicted protein [Naegleria gruberi strain NEG-M]